MFPVDEKGGAETAFKQTYPERSGINPLTLLSGWSSPACFANSYLKTGRQWFDCVECHHEQRPDHELQKANELVSHQEQSPNLTTNGQMQTLACKKCRKVFRKDPSDFEERFAGYYVC
jgi:hypothetical protein